MKLEEEALSREVGLVWAHKNELDINLKSNWDSMGMRATDSIGMNLKGI